MRHPHLARSLVERFTGGPRVLFVHIPKTAGMSLYGALQTWAGREASFRFAQGTAADIEVFRRWPQARIDELRLLSGHLRYPVFRERVGSEWRAITVLRDPGDRWLSSYSYVMGWDEHPLHETFKAMDADTYFEWSARDDNAQTMAICGAPDPERAYAVLRQQFWAAAVVENLPAMAARLSSTLKVPLDIGHRNASQALPIAPSVVEAARQRNAADLELYRRVRAEGLVGWCSAR